MRLLNNIFVDALVSIWKQNKAVQEVRSLRDDFINLLKLHIFWIFCDLLIISSFHVHTWKESLCCSCWEFNRIFLSIFVARCLAFMANLNHRVQYHFWPLWQQRAEQIIEFGGRPWWWMWSLEQIGPCMAELQWFPVSWRDIRVWRRVFTFRSRFDLFTSRFH